jgi:AbiU2
MSRPISSDAAADESCPHNYVDDTCDTFIHARLCHEAWWLTTRDHPDRDKIVWVFNFYLHFFGTVQPALFVTFIIKLASLFGTRSDEITIRLVPGIESDSSFPFLWERRRRLHKYRSKLIAHRDIELGLRDFAREARFTFNDLETLLNDTCAIFDSAARRLAITPIHRFSCQSDLLRLVYDLKISASRRRRRCENPLRS